MAVEAVAQCLCDLSIRFSGVAKRKMARPFGTSLLIAGVDRKLGPQLIHTEPSGTYVSYDAKAIGNGCDTAQVELKEQFYNDMSLDEAAIVAVQILKQVMEGKASEETVVMGIVHAKQDENGLYEDQRDVFEEVTGEKLKNIVSSAVADANARHAAD